MKFWLVILLLAVCLPDWTTARRRGHHRRVQDSEIEDGTVINIVMTNSTHIDLSYLEIDSFERYAASNIERENVKSLDLSHNNFHSLDNVGFPSFPNLEKLLLSDNKITDLGYFGSSFKNLKYLDISSNPITESLMLYQSTIRGLPASTIIYIGADKIYPSEPLIVPFDYEQNRLKDWDFPEENRPKLYKNFEIKLCKTVDGLVRSVEELKDNVTLDDCMRVDVVSKNNVLDLSHLGLRKFQRNWYKFESDAITRLKLYNNEITDITPELLNDLPSKVTFVDLRWNNIKVIRNNTINNTYIRTMMLDNNFISTIEDSAFENTNVDCLILQRNRLDDLTFFKTLPTSLKYLELSHNFFPVISETSLQGPKILTLLVLSGCHIATIEPGAFENLEKLSYLDLAFNQISELKPGLFRGVENLHHFDISFNRIQKIPGDIFSGSKDREMRELRFDHNQIDTIEAGSFFNLTIDRMNLERNKITEKSVAKDVFEASLVRELNLGYNLISEINESFLDSPTLENLNLTKNHIRSIKKGVIKNMHRLRDLDLSENPLNHLENGVFHRLNPERNQENEHIQINLSRVPIEYIEARVFADVSNQ